MRIFVHIVKQDVRGGGETRMMRHTEREEAVRRKRNLKRRKINLARRSKQMKNNKSLRIHSAAPPLVDPSERPAKGSWAVRLERSKVINLYTRKQKAKGLILRHCSYLRKAIETSKERPTAAPKRGSYFCVFLPRNRFQKHRRRQTTKILTVFALFKRNTPNEFRFSTVV